MVVVETMKKEMEMRKRQVGKQWKERKRSETLLRSMGDFFFRWGGKGEKKNMRKTRGWRKIKVETRTRSEHKGEKYGY